ncbi:MAG: 16S rRNA (cytosine(1402)-N(4))-methyltransferase RsmH [Spirochaetales bacterium]|nr:16S rRNA (cytosine(1402)-N(4))-methyltransferase RsmH [Spirochaetales bacterium]
MSYVHSPVLLNQVLANLVGERDLLMLDCTLGEGGHSEAVLQNFSNISVLGLDRDAEILAVATDRMSAFQGRFAGLNVNFADVTAEDILASPLGERFRQNGGFDAILVDLGISVYHYKISQKGFSFGVDQPLDMRLSSVGMSAADIINTYTESQLLELLYRYAEEKHAKLIVRRILEKRVLTPITTTKQLADIIASAVPKKFQTKIHPATKTFQALRIAVNNEFGNIERGIPNLMNLLKTGGRMAVITFHSLEDRIVKNIFADMYKDCICPPSAPICTCNKRREIQYIVKHAEPDDEEVKRNPPSRSAKIRIVEKI